jgi:signal transduction histidine kinase
MRLFRTWLVAFGLVFAFALAAGGSLVGRAFPGFLVQPLVYVSPYQLGPLVGLEPLDRVLTADGKVVTSARQLLAAPPPGTAVTYTVERAGRAREVVVRSQAFRLGDVAGALLALLLGALGCTAIGMVAYRQRPDLPAARALAGTLGALGFALALYFDFNTTALAARAFLVAYPLTGAGVFALALTFPHPWGAVQRRPWLVRAPWLAGLALALLLQVLHTELGPAVAPQGPMFGLMIGLNVWTMAAIAALLAAIVVRFALAPRATLVRHQAGAALAGALVGFAPFGVWALQQALGWPEWGPLRLALLALVAFPAAIAYAMVRARLFDTTLVIRNSLVYGALSAILSAVYVALVVLVRVASGQAVPGATLAGDLFATGVVVALFAPVRDRVQHLIDRKLFRARYDATQALEEASQSLTSLLDLDAIVARVVAAIEATLQVEGARVVLAGPLLDALRPHPEVLSAAPLPVARPHRVVPALDAALVLPITFQDALTGALVLGPKRSETPFTDSDLRLLGLLANQSAIAIENARSYRQIQAFNQELEATVRQRTAEAQEAQARALQAEKMAALGQLVAGVAHELNNPLAFVVAGAGLLARDMPRLLELQAACEAGDVAAAQELSRRLAQDEVREEVEAVLVSCREGAERMREVIAHLRDFSRLDAFELAELDLTRCLQATLALVEPSYRKRVRFHVALAPGVTIRGSENHLAQVFMNLLVNACQAIEGEGDVWVRLEADGPGARVSFRDSGQGMGPEVLNRVFEPFFTTKPVGMGTGLGLSICHGIIERHSGSIACLSEVGTGTTFTVTLPLLQGSPSLVHHPGR